ncbi:MAG: hypothetical protein IKM87_00215 [Clostridia bacterium]|nr:hypothetical protein [Clostridia bacterium]
MKILKESTQFVSKNNKRPSNIKRPIKESVFVQSTGLYQALMALMDSIICLYNTIELKTTMDTLTEADLEDRIYTIVDSINTLPII